MIQGRARTFSCFKKRLSNSCHDEVCRVSTGLLPPSGYLILRGPAVDIATLITSIQGIFVQMYADLCMCVCVCLLPCKCGSPGQRWWAQHSAAAHKPAGSTAHDHCETWAISTAASSLGLDHTQTNSWGRFASERGVLLTAMLTTNSIRIKMVQCVVETPAICLTGTWGYVMKRDADAWFRDEARGSGEGK